MKDVKHSQNSHQNSSKIDNDSKIPAMYATVLRFFDQSNENILLMEEILHLLIGSLSHDVPGFIHPKWRRISSINSRVGFEHLSWCGAPWMALASIWQKFWLEWIASVIEVDVYPVFICLHEHMNRLTSSGDMVWHGGIVIEALVGREVRKFPDPSLLERFVSETLCKLKRKTTYYSK